MRVDARRGLWCAALCAAVVFLGQYLTVRFNRGGDWSSLFCAGASYPAAPDLAWERHYVFPHVGFDGQIYHLIAHDPFLRHGLDKYVDTPRLRYRRILLPLAAYMTALGRPRSIDAAYRGVILLFVFLGAWWCAAYATAVRRSPAWGLGFALVPAVLISAERMTVDVALVALTAGFSVYARDGPPWKLGLIIALACLARETGFLLAAAVFAHALLRRERRTALVAVAAVVPTLLWFAYVQQRTQPYDYRHSFVPMSGIAAALREPAPPPIVRPGQAAERWRRAVGAYKPTIDRIALLGAVLAFGLGFRELGRRPLDAIGLAAAMFAVMGVLIQRPDNWLHVYDYGRVYSPLLILLGLRGLEDRRIWPSLLATFMMLLRLSVELATLVLGILRALLPSL